MNCHHFWGIAFFSIFSSAIAQASMSYTVSGMSNQIGSVYYYSNIANTVTAGYYDNASAVPTTCSTTRNPNCKEPTSILIVSTITNATVNASTKLVLYANTSAPAVGTTVNGVSNTVSFANYTTTNTTYTFSTLTFNDFCTAAGSASCQGDGPLYVSIIFDIDGSNTYSTGDEISTFTLYLLSQPPQYSNAPVANEGLNSFISFPGDSKVYITSPQVGAGSDFPTLVNIAGVQKVRYYYDSVTPIASMTASGNNYKEASINVDGTTVSFSPNYASGLTNGTPYCIITALVDNAGNIAMETNTTDRNATTMCATPDRVIGLMSNSGQCFIATAAFGSPLAEQVRVLRKFRDVYLLKSHWGKKFVSWYYDHSPKWAEKIENREDYKKIVRTALWPLVGYSILSLKWGVTNATLFFITLMLLPLLSIQFLVIKKRGLR